jgi:hypothetical protein
MHINSIYINLPTENISRTREFWTKLGFGFNEEFSNEQAICLVLKEGHIYAMFINKDMFSTFTNRPISNGTTQALFAIQVENREKVDSIVKLALENGGTRYSQSQDYGWMYYDSFSDLDGHQWEVMFSDPNLRTQQAKPTNKITVKTIVLARRQKVWDYYTQPQHITKWNFASEDWCCPWATNDLRVGGRYIARMEAKDGSFGFDFDATYTGIKVGEYLNYEFGGRFATVKFNELNDRQTEVTVTFDPENENPLDLQRQGWQAILDNFKKYTETN